MHRLLLLPLGLLILAIGQGCTAPAASGDDAVANTSNAPITKDTKPMDNMAQATFGGGCFWCTEAVFLELDGVERVISGYSGGRTENPTYREVCTGATGHAEVIHVEYDPQKIPFEQLLEVFFKTHDPTTLNRQGADVGTQYRSVVFYHNAEQKKIAEDVIEKLDKSGAYNDPIVTEVAEFEKLYPAEDYHQSYYAQNASAPYCQMVVQPKLDKFREVFKDKLKKPEAAPK